MMIFIVIGVKYLIIITSRSCFLNIRHCINKNKLYTYFISYNIFF